LLAVAVAASGVLLLSFDARLSFIGDEWELLIGRSGGGVGVLLEPFNENPIIGLAVVYKLLLAVFGMSSALPFYCVSIVLFLISAVLLDLYLVPRVGAWPAALSAVLVLFLGAAYEDIFWAFQMGFFGSVAAGLGALIALDRRGLVRNRLACCLLIVSLAFSSVGIAFVAAALVDLALDRGNRTSRAYVAVVPVIVYGVWWLVWGKVAGNQIGLDTVLRVPGYVFDAATAGMVSLLGREAVTADGRPPMIGEVLLIVLIIVAGVHLIRRRHVPRSIAVAFVLALSFWVLIGLDRTGGGRFALNSRYQYPSAVFILTLTAELLRGLRIPRMVTVAFAVIAAGAVVGGISTLQRHFPQWESRSDRTRLTLTALELGRPSVRASYLISFPPSISFRAGTYFKGSTGVGSPAFDEGQLLARSADDRRHVDEILAAALDIKLTPAVPIGKPQRCRTLSDGPASGSAEIPAGILTLQNPGPRPTRVRLGRFATGLSVPLDRIPAGATRILAVPSDSSNRRWRVATLDQNLRLCIADRMHAA